MQDKKYSLLLVAFVCHYSHVARFVKLLKSVNPSVEITLLADRYDISNEIKDNVDRILYKHCFNAKMPSWLAPLKHMLDLMVLGKQFRLLAKHHRYDIVNIHYCQYYMAYYIHCLRKIGKKMVITPWGSDVLRVNSRFKLAMLGFLYRRADMITVGPQGSVGSVVLRTFRADENKLRALGWGSETIDYINENSGGVTTNDAKVKLGLSGRYVITCGYNAFEQQRHETMIKAICAIKHELPENLTLLFPLTYGSSIETKKKNYVEQIKQWCKESELNAVFYEEYLSVSELFFLRLGTDMFIHIQTTDAGNSSLQEYVLCGKKVVHGTWIHYPHLEQYKPLFYFPVDSLDTLGNAILKAYHSDPIKTPPEVMEYIRNRGWKAKMKLWDDFFCSICK